MIELVSAVLAVAACASTVPESGTTVEPTFVHPPSRPAPEPPPEQPPERGAPALTMPELPALPPSAPEPLGDRWLHARDIVFEPPPGPGDRPVARWVLDVVRPWLSEQYVRLREGAPAAPLAGDWASIDLALTAYVLTANAVVATDAARRLADAEPETLTMSLMEFESGIYSIREDARRMSHECAQTARPEVWHQLCVQLFERLPEDGDDPHRTAPR